MFFYAYESTLSIITIKEKRDRDRVRNRTERKEKKINSHKWHTRKHNNEKQKENKYNAQNICHLHKDSAIFTLKLSLFFHFSLHRSWLLELKEDFHTFVQPHINRQAAQYCILYCHHFIFSSPHSLPDTPNRKK